MPNQSAAIFAQTPAPTSMGEIFSLYLALFVYLAVAYPLLGGAILWLGFQWAKVPDFTFVKCWKIYLAGLCYGYLVIFGLRMILEPAPAIPTILFFVVPLIAIPILGKNLTPRVVVVEVIAILLANSVMVALLFTVPFVIGPPRASGLQETAPVVDGVGRNPMIRQRPRDVRPGDVPARDGRPRNESK